MKKKKSAARGLAERAKEKGAAARRRAEDLLALIGRRKARILDDFYDIGEALVELDRKKLYAALGFATFDELLEGRDVLGRSQAYKLMAIVRQLPRARAIDLGQERAYALAALAAATPYHETAGELVETGLTIHGKKLDVTKMSKRDLEAAKKDLGTRKDPKRAAASAQARAIARALRGRRVAARVSVVRSGRGWDAVVRAPVADWLRLLAR